MLLVSYVILDRTSTRPLARALAWLRRGATTCAVVGLAVAALPLGAAATTAADLCATTDNPCRVSTVVPVTPGSMIDLNTRALLVTGTGSLSLTSGTMTLRAGSITVQAGGSLRARGTGATPGGQIVASAGTITISGNIDATGTPGGGVSLTSTGVLTLGGLFDVSSSGSEADGGSADLQGTNVTITGRINARGSGQESSGGFIDVAAAGALLVANAMDVSGSDGGSIDLSADTTLTVNSNVSLFAGATASAGSGGDIGLSATGELTMDGQIFADGKNGTEDTGGGDGGVITIDGGSIRATVADPTISATGGSPDGIGGDIDWTTDVGDLNYPGRIVAQGTGLEGEGGEVSVDATGAATFSDEIDVSSGSGGGGTLDLSSAADFTVAAGASLLASATNMGGGGDIAISSGRVLTVLGTLVSDGGGGGLGGSNSLDGCTVRVERSGTLSSLGSGGTNTLSGADLTVVAGTLRAQTGTGRNVIRFAGPDYEPAILGSAQIAPNPILTEDFTLVPCNPLPTLTPTATRTGPTATATRTGSIPTGGSPTITRTPTATPTPGGCVGDCDDSGAVTVSDMVTGVNIVLGNRPVDDCRPFDADGSDTVGINELIQGVNNLLNGCPPQP